MLTQLEQIPLMCHQLKLKLKPSVSGKNATFVKVKKNSEQLINFLNTNERLLG
jgi:hypothetical protein